MSTVIIIEQSDDDFFLYFFFFVQVRVIFGVNFFIAQQLCNMFPFVLFTTCGEQPTERVCTIRLCGVEKNPFLLKIETNCVPKVPINNEPIFNPTHAWRMTKTQNTTRKHALRDAPLQVAHLPHPSPSPLLSLPLLTRFFLLLLFTRR